jgi:hypothetical protein
VHLLIIVGKIFSAGDRQRKKRSDNVKFNLREEQTKKWQENFL